MNPISSIWKAAVQKSAEPDRVRHFLELLPAPEAEALLKTASAEDARILAALLSGSNALGNLLVSRPEWLPGLRAEQLQFPRRAEGLRKEAQEGIAPFLSSGDTRSALAWIRSFKQREMIRIAARDLGRLAQAPQIIREISDVADVCLSRVWQICLETVTGRHGSPWHQAPDGAWVETEASVLGLGKLGGQELNYSSDVDVLFVYAEEGQVFREKPSRTKVPRAVMSNHQFFNRVAESFIAEIARPAPEGMLYRIDLRLRPEGDAGPLCRSLGSYENYYAQWGQTWERMMLIKARGVAGSSNLGGEFLESIQAFRYSRTLGESVLQEIAAMKARIENEVVKTGELDRNVKLGRGGIREVEFIAQSQQLLHGGKLPFLQGAQTLPALDKLAQYHLLPESEAGALREAYCFLRDVEHRLQMEENLQTHTLPPGKPARERLARLMGFKGWTGFETARKGHCGRVRRTFETLLGTGEASGENDARLPASFAGAENEWKRILEQHAFRDPGNAFQVLREFVEGPGYVHVSRRTIDLARKLLPRLFALCPGPAPGRNRSRRKPRETDEVPFRLSDPDRVITRLDSFISAYGARAVLFELWNNNPSIFDLLVKLFDRSEFLAELAIRVPDLVDELVTSGRLRQRKNAGETLRDLRHGFGDADQHLWIRRYHQAELMRIGLRDILGLADPEQYLTELSALADASLQYALEVAIRRHRLKAPPFAIIGLGKLGGQEIDYGSDLDVIFVANDRLKNLRKVQQVALDVMDLLSARTEAGIVFQTDARLRPDGEKGLLVNTLSAYEDYYRRRAQLWEIQTLTRTRIVAGDLEVGETVLKLAAKLADFSRPNLPLAAYSDDWKSAIHSMRLRIERERTPKGRDELAIKTGKGGFMDAEFIAQALCLENGWHEPNTLAALERGRETAQGSRRAVSSSDRRRPVSPALFDKLISGYRQMRRVEGILRRWSYEGETVLPEDPAPFYRVAVRCGFDMSEHFREALARWRSDVREGYNAYFVNDR